MAGAKQLTGNRAKVYVDDVLVGVFDSCNYSVQIGVEPSFVLGRTSAAEIPVTSYEPVRVDCSGLRVVGQGVHTLPKFPKLQDLLNLKGVTISVIDRKAKKEDKPIAVIKDCIPTTNGIGFQAKTSTKFQISYIGLVAEDEYGAQAEPTGAASF